MNEQISFMDVDSQVSKEIKLVQAIMPVILDAMGQYGLETDYLKIEPKKSYTSINILDKLLLRVRCSKNLRYINCRPLNEDQEDLLASFRVTRTKADRVSGFIRINLNDLNISPELEQLISAIVTNFADKLSKTFDCCSRYEACSDAKRCVHPDPAYASGCRYCKNLNQGRIFYGRNRNID